MKRVVLLVLVIISLLLFAVGPATHAATTVQIKELNFVFLHGAAGNSCAMQLLSDSITAKLPNFIAEYERENPGIKIQVDSINRCYPNNVDINVWANNIASSIKNYIHPNNLILIGHSMGGKTALYMTAHNIGNLADKVAAVVTVNSPVKNLSQYYFPGGASYWQAAWLIPQDHGVIGSLVNYDSSADGAWVSTHKHWLALCSAESSPMSKQFDVSGVDPLPRDMDDSIVPISAQYAEGADMVYYGEHGHSDFETDPVVASYQAEFILRYIFGGTIEYSVLDDQGSFKHTAGWMPVAYRWNDTIGEFPIQTGTLVRKNNTFQWQNYEDIVGQSTISEERSSFETKLTSIPVLSALLEANWASVENVVDARLLLRTRAAPKTSIRVDWVINGYEEVEGRIRDHYEVEIDTGTPFTAIEDTQWVTDNANDFRLEINSQAEGPLRWFEASWRTYHQEYFPRKVIDEMAITPVQ